MEANILSQESATRWRFFSLLLRACWDCMNAENLTLISTIAKGHFVLFNKKYGSLVGAVASGEKDALLVIGIFVSVSCCSFHALRCFP